MPPLAPPPPEPGAAPAGVAPAGAWAVVVSLPIGTVDFAPPHGWDAPDSQSGVPVGCRVLVPWRSELVVGLVVAEAESRPSARLREVVQVLESPDSPWVNPATVAAVMLWAQQAHIPPGLILSDLLGVGWKLDWKTTHLHLVRAVPDATLELFGPRVPGQAWQNASTFDAPLLDHIREQGLLDEQITARPRLQTVIQARERLKVPPAARSVTVLEAKPWQEVGEKVRLERVLMAVNEAQDLPPRQAGALAWLAQHGPQPSLSAWAKGAGVTPGIAQKVLDSGAAQWQVRERAPLRAWVWLHEHGPVRNLSAWARGAGVSSSEVNAVLDAGGADYAFIEPEPPAAWTWLREYGPQGSVAAWASGAGITPGAAGALLAKGWAEQVQIPAPAPELPPEVPLPPADAPDTLPEAPIWRLHGGRPAERFRALAPRLLRLLEQGRSVLVLAPDQTTLRRAWAGLSGLGQQAGTRAVQFSGTLSDVQREESWRLIRGGEARLVIGTALALVAPLPELALLVVLEEGSDAHKLLSGSRAFVPDIAAQVAHQQDAALALVGCVPAAESVPVPGLVLPPPRARVHVVDYANPPQQPELGPLSSVHLKGSGDMGYPLSHDLSRLLRQVQERGRQAVLLAPRRGYSALLRCPNCEHTPQCKNCDVALRFHQDTRQMTCHQCGYHEGIPDRCDNCGERMWKARGPGTEWIAQEVRKLLPGFPVLRLDKDHQDDLSGWLAGEAGVVVGTQLLLSQPAPPNLALIGVTLADTWLNVPDFRASERYHRLLRQLLEWHPARAPLLVVQTFQADHPALKVVQEGRDALAYPRAEERVRQELGYPPYARLAQLEVSAREASRAQEAAQQLAAALHGAGATAHEVLGPAPSPIARLRGVYPYHLMLRARDDARLAELLRVVDSRSWKARIRVDVNPRGGI